MTNLFSPRDVAISTRQSGVLRLWLSIAFLASALILACATVCQALSAEGFEDLRREAQQGVAEAQYALAVMYANGLGVFKDLKEAVKWFRKAAAQGNVSAQNYLGWMY